MATFNPFNPDGTWNYEGASKANKDELAHAWDQFKKDKGLSDATEPGNINTSEFKNFWGANFFNKAGRSWQSEPGRRGHRSTVNADFDPWSKKTSNPYLRFSSPGEAKGFYQWVEIESAGAITTPTVEHWYERWLSVGFKIWQKYSDTPLWEMKTEERNEYLTWRKTIGGLGSAFTEKELIDMWKAHKDREKKQSTYEWFKDQKDFYENPWESANGKSDRYRQAYGQRTNFGGFNRHTDTRSAKRKLFEQIFDKQSDMILSAFGDHERRKRRMEENQYRTDNPVGVIKVVSTPTLKDQIHAKLMKECRAGKIPMGATGEMMEKLYRPNEEITVLSDQIAKILLNPLTRFDYAE